MDRAYAMEAWVDRSYAFIKSLAPKQLVTIGIEGDTPDASFNGMDFSALIGKVDYEIGRAHV